MGYPSLGFRQGHIWVAKDEGLFERYGLNVEPVFLRGGQLAIQALAAGDPPLMSIGQVVQANLSGFNLVLIAGVESFYDSIIFGRPGTTRPEQLKGKRLGMPQAKNAKPEQFVDLSLLQELEKEGFFNEIAKRYPST
jgi:ABC-type nitrate/sulfonate/bicarbonate transport system substrate-binding protein